MVVEVPKSVRDRVKARSGGLCERCGASLEGRSASLHHRRARGMGGAKDARLNEPESLVVLCGSGTSGCHGWVESNREVAIGQGWLVLRRDPRAAGEVPVFAGGAWYLVGADGWVRVDLRPPF